MTMRAAALMFVAFLSACAGGGGAGPAMTGADASPAEAGQETQAEAPSACVTVDVCPVVDFANATTDSLGSPFPSATCTGRTCGAGLMCVRFSNIHCRIPAATNPFHVDIYCGAVGDNDCNEQVTGTPCPGSYHNNVCVPEDGSAGG